MCLLKCGFNHIKRRSKEHEEMLLAVYLINRKDSTGMAAANGINRMGLQQCQVQTPPTAGCVGFVFHMDPSDEAQSSNTISEARVVPHL